MNLQQWFHARQGTSILVPGGGAGNSGQCFQAMDDCLHYVYNKPYLYMGDSGGAIDVWNKVALDQFGFVRIPAGQPIRAGDFIFFDRLAPKPGGGYYGHVNIASRDGTVQDFYAYNTNWNNNKTLQEYHHTGAYNGYVVGYYRLPGGKGGGTPPNTGDQPMIIQATNNWFARCDKTMRFIRGRGLGGQEFQKYAVGQEFLHWVEEVEDNPEADAAYQAQNVGQLAMKDKWNEQIYGLEAQVKQYQADLGNALQNADLSKQQRNDLQAKYDAAEQQLNSITVMNKAATDNATILAKLAGFLHIPGY